MSSRKSKPRVDCAAASADDVYQHALRFLTRREHARSELQRKLTARGYPEPRVLEALERLAAENYLSDVRYAGAIARTRFSQGYGPMRIRSDLRRFRLDDDLVENALGELEVDWDAQARSIRQHRFGEALPTNHKERIRQAGFLSRRGFTPSQARYAVSGSE